ncbi:GNAT family N-acetyltransferase [Mucilaginibacter sp. cycad4]|uniref:GNAT family N-acetyltransferase n=1 Tax=Mucilaginibacter sp. cycad4 TaxID=3342096 RepID=UPI002AAB21BB|nr:GNAT family N-acetyltransferase [Mucilaginibacter gossypii]WPU97835.1 GNAT family N-acetyltransferase [Mucilaginibacter gossypii]
MKKAAAADKSIVLYILSRAFSKNRSVNYIVKQDKNRLLRIEALMDYSYEVCSQFGEVLLSDDSNACVLLLYPQFKRTTLKSIWLDIKLIFQAIGLSNINKTIKRENQIKKFHPKIDMIYLWFIGVQPERQNLGTGSTLLTEVLAEADLKALPVYLETSTLINIPWYERFGFKVYNRLELDYTLFFLKREPDK